MFDLGQGVQQDYAQAAIWYSKAAAKGNANGQFNLGLMYFNGIGVPQDYSKAAKWLRKAADKGNANAQSDLGWIYQNGYGVPQDNVRALMWFDLAVSGASDAEISGMAAKFRDELTAKMTPAQIAEAQRLAREWVPKTNQPASP
jgi:uncharacterized protein